MLNLFLLQSVVGHFPVLTSQSQAQKSRKTCCGSGFSVVSLFHQAETIEQSGLTGGNGTAGGLGISHYQDFRLAKQANHTDCTIIRAKSSFKNVVQSSPKILPFLLLSVVVHL